MTRAVEHRPIRTALGTDAGISWTVSAAGGLGPTRVRAAEIAAVVPGEVHLDLLRAGLIPEPFDGANEAELAWIGRTDWTYRATFDWVPPSLLPARAGGSGAAAHHDLVFEGLDTVASIRLNDAELGATANQHRSYRFDLTELLRAGPNDLEITFSAPVTAAEERSAELGERPFTNAHPFNAIRKMASSYGWDWGPDLAGVGIWKPLRIESWSGVRIVSVRPLSGLDALSGDGVLDASVRLEWDPRADRPVVVRVEVGVGEDEQRAEQTVPPGQSDAVVQLRLPAVLAWWPRGYGEQPLYPVRVTVLEQTPPEQTPPEENQPEETTVRDAWSGRVGFREVTLSTAPDVHGSEFDLRVNGRSIFVKGANWIPDDAFLTRVDTTRYRRALLDATEAGMNLLRVWGGGIVESEDFYDACDELGLLVWQDFLLACAAYSEDEPLFSEFEAEAREAVARLSAHPSLALWNGGNENLWGYVEWNWRAPLAGRSWGDRYYRELFPAIVAELDPRTPYSAGSPYSFAEYHHPNDPRHGSTHLWEVWNRDDYNHYRDSVPRFVSEFGFQGPPSWSTLTSVVHDQPMDPHGPQMLVHQKAADGNAKLERGLGDHLPHWRTDSTTGQVDLDDWHWITQLNQARAVSYGISHFRSHFPRNRGSIVWQLNDNWPVISWAAVDAHQIRKPLWFALRDVHREHFLTWQPRPVAGSDAGSEQPGERLALILHNDSDEAWTGEVLVSRRPVDGGAATASEALPFALSPRSSWTATIGDGLVVPVRPEAEFLLAEVDADTVAFGYFVEDPQLRLAGAEDALRLEVERIDQGYAVHAEARSLVKDLTLFPDRLDPTATVDSALVSLAAGQRHTFVVRTEAELDPAALTGKPVLRSVNDLGRGSAGDGPA